MSTKLHDDMLPREHEPGGFYTWLSAQVKHENGNVRDLARDLASDQDAKLRAANDEQFRQYLNERTQEPQTVNLAYIAYVGTLKRKEIKFVEDQPDFLLDGLVVKIDLTDGGNADYVECCAKGRIKHVAETDTWYVADDNDRWYVDRSGDVLQIIEQAMRLKLAATARLVDTKEKERHRHALRSCDTVKIQHAAQMLRHRRRVAILPGVFDADPWLLGTENAVLDLETGKPKEKSLDVLVARRAPVRFEPGASRARWMKYLEKVQPDPEVRDVLAQIAGTCLTGVQMEKCFLFFLGDGGNGKSVFMRVMQELLGPDYAFVCKKALIFQPHKNAGEQAAGDNDKADLVGKRLITAAEQVGRRWNLEFIKDYTGGEKQHGRQLYSVSNNFMPTGKIIIPANDEPGMDEFTEAVRRRFALIRWPVTLIEEEKEPFEPYIDELKKDLPGILNWALEGLAKLRKNKWRLILPESAIEDTREYLSEQDQITAFLEAQFEGTSLDDPKFCNVSDMYKRFTENWLEDDSKYVIKKNRFTRRLQAFYGKKRVVRGDKNKMIVRFLTMKT